MISRSFLCNRYRMGADFGDFGLDDRAMTPISRRNFLASSVLSIAATRLRAHSIRQVRAALAIPAKAAGPKIPADFAGLSYEVEQLADPAFFSRNNSGLIRAFKTLVPRGVLRLGGNTSEFSWWKPAPESAEPAHPQIRETVGEPKARYFALTADAVRNLAEFLKATGWTCIYGINMGTNSPQRAAEEAEFAAKILGENLQCFQIGNEVDLFSRHLRDPQTWSAKTYLDEWLTLARAIETRVPGARFGMPDVASDISWLTQIADLLSAVKNPPRVTTLTHHHYFGGPATNPEVNIVNLLKAATMTKVQATADAATAAASKMGARVRMTEGNTCYRGGKPGVSDVFAAALWAADYSLLLASNGYSGVNLHGGTGMSVANSVGGSLPGDAILKERGATPEQIAAHPHPFYTPIATFGSEYVLEPVALGLIFAGSIGGGRFIEADLTSKLQAADVNASAYAARLSSGETSVIVLNKDGEKDIDLYLDFGPAGEGPVEVETLHAPALDSRGAAITRSANPQHLKNGKLSIAVPRATGLRLTVG